MQSLSLSFRRLYATIPTEAAIARSASTPLAVRTRRLRKNRAIEPGKTDANTRGLTPTEVARYRRLSAKGELGPVGKETSEEEWIERLNARRSRLRGIRTIKKSDGQKETQVVGQPVYLPNIIFTLVRNHTLPGQPYNPYEATFRIPQSVTKTDVRSYLLAVYGVKTTYIRTDNYIQPYRAQGSSLRQWITKYKRSKRAVVGLVDPFYYPLRLEDMGEEEKNEREKWIEDTFQIQRSKETSQLSTIRLSKQGQEHLRWRGPLTVRRSTILKLVAERKTTREGVVAKQVQEWRGMRERGEHIDVQLRRKPSVEEPAASV